MKNQDRVSVYRHPFGRLSGLFLFFFLAALIGCGGGGSGLPGTGNTGGNDGGRVVTTDAPASTIDFLSLQAGPVVLRHADGENAVDETNVATLRFVRTDPDESRLGLIEAKGGFTLNHGFSGAPVLMGGKVIGVIRQGYDNSSNMPDNLHADIIDIHQMIDEYTGSRAFNTTVRSYSTPFFAPSEMLRNATWARPDRPFIGLDAASREHISTSTGTARSRGGRPSSMQGKGVAFMYSPYIYASGHASFQVDADHLLALGHPVTQDSSSVNLPVSEAFSFRMNDGTMAAIPVAKGEIGVATKSLNYSTVIQLNVAPTTSTSRARMLAADGTEIKAIDAFLAQDSDAYNVSFANMVSLTMAIPRLIEAGYGSSGATGKAFVHLHVPVKDGTAYDYTYGEYGFGYGGGDYPPPVAEGKLAQIITDWVSSMTYEVFSFSEQPVWGTATLEVTKVN